MEAREVLEKVKNNEISIEEAEKYFKKEPFEEMGYAKLDTHREIRSGFAEVIFCARKADEHLLKIFTRLYEQDGEVFGTRASEHQYELIREKFPEKTIWMYTGDSWEDIYDLPIMQYVDVVVDGEFHVEEKDVKLLWKGSKNQRVIDVKKTLAGEHPEDAVLHCGDYK